VAAVLVGDDASLMWMRLSEFVVGAGDGKRVVRACGGRRPCVVVPGMTMQRWPRAVEEIPARRSRFQGRDVRDVKHLV